MRQNRRELEEKMEKTWLKHYPAGVPAEIDVAQYRSLVALLEESFKKYGNAIAYRFMGKAISFAQVDQQSRAFAAYLQGLGPSRRPAARWASSATGWWPSSA